MRIFLHLFVIGAFALNLILLSSAASAAEPLMFGDQLTQNQKSLLMNSLEVSNLDDYDFSKIDLNDDGIKEIISVRRSCKQNISSHAFCTYNIYSISGKNVHTIASFETRTLELGNVYFKGVRDIHIYNEKDNEFDYTVMRWSPLYSKFQPLDRGS